MNTTWRANHVDPNGIGGQNNKDGNDVDVMDKDASSRKKLTYDSTPLANATNPQGTGQVIQIVGQLNNHKNKTNEVPTGGSTLGKTQPVKRSRTAGEEQNPIISTTSMSEADQAH